MEKNYDLIVVGGGLAGLSAAMYASLANKKVLVIEKNKNIGGRINSFESQGFVFDMGPSWLWMLDIFTELFTDFNKDIFQELDLVKLDPAFKLFTKDQTVSLPQKMTQIEALILEHEGGLDNWHKFLQHAAFTYKNGVEVYMKKPSNSFLEFLDPKFLSSIFKAGLFTSYSTQVRKYFKSEIIRQILEFPVLFLGSTPQKTPYLYSLLAHTMIVGGTWYPMGGMRVLAEKIKDMAVGLGIDFVLETEINKVKTENSKVISIFSDDKEFIAKDYIFAGDYKFFEDLLPKKDRRYGEKYWKSRTMSPSSLLYYLGVNKKLPGLEHHNLFFDTDFQKHAIEIYDSPNWPSDPLFYVSVPSKTDSTVAPLNQENLFILIPVASDISGDTQELRDKYLNIVLDRMEQKLAYTFRENIVYQSSFGPNDFKSVYNSFGGNAYGLANTLMQTAIFKPKLRSKLKNLRFAGQLTVPGPGMPPVIISGKMAVTDLYT